MNTESASAGATYGGATIGLLSWLFSLETWVAIVSIIVAVLGLIVHTVATVRKDRREKVEHEARMEAFRNGATEALDRDPAV